MTTLAQLSEQQLNKSVTVNDDFMAVSPAGLFGVNNSLTSALTFAYYGGYMLVDGVQTLAADGTLALTASQTNYIEATRAGVVSKNVVGFTAGSTPLYTAVTGTATITTLTDYRVLGAQQPDGVLTKAMSSDANYTLSAAEARNRILQIIGGTALSATRNIFIPAVARYYIVYNGSTGAQSIQFITPSGSPQVGVVIANGKRAIIYCDGADVWRVTPDT